MPNLEASEVFTPLAIEVLKASAKKLKIKTPSLLSIGNNIQIIDRLGGFLGRKDDGEPGIIGILRGWRNLQERIEFMEA
jgi:hypothetical protein